MDKQTTDLNKFGNVDIEALSRNIARLIEEGGKALAAYLKPREEGKIKTEFAEDITDAVKSLGRVAEYWLSDPQRAFDLQTSLGRAYLDLWAGAVKRMAGDQSEPVAAPDLKDKRFADPDWSEPYGRDYVVQTCCQEMAENNHDFAHFMYVHGTPDIPWWSARTLRPPIVSSPMLKNLTSGTEPPFAFFRTSIAVGPCTWNR